MEYHERRIRLSDEQMAAIAELAAERALNKVYQEVGKSVVKKFLLLAGSLAVGLVIFLHRANIKISW